ncbi:type II toxin-antitoxin system RelE/ParE family toxin [Terriglobus sp.]|uniref:type II toxin-antitoxin system RelE/ParE family toxin n=1 Tax=Terriglobus sp. TaxID=1889013 RepID=UPI003AFF7639
MLELSEYVESDLEAIGDWIAEGSPERAVSFVREIREEFARIGSQPHLFRLRPEIGNGVRLAVKGSYVILFWIDEDTVRIERVIHGSRNLSERLR